MERYKDLSTYSVMKQAYVF